jgi:hypothetical protein
MFFLDFSTKTDISWFNQMERTSFAELLRGLAALWYCHQTHRGNLKLVYNKLQPAVGHTRKLFNMWFQWMWMMTASQVWCICRSDHRDKRTIGNLMCSQIFDNYCPSDHYASLATHVDLVLTKNINLKSI